MSLSVIFHIDEMEKWSLLLVNVHNLLNALEDKNFSFDVLANSEAVKFYTSLGTDPLYNRMSELATAGVQFVACNNALTTLGIQKEQLPSYIRIVPAGVLELIEKQHQRYAYIKP